MIECILETNLDDVSGELLGYVAERLFEEGAKDVCFIPIIAKKGRPGFMLQVICERRKAKKLAEVIMAETGTLGVRKVDFVKYVAERKIYKVKTEFGEVKVKVSETPRFPRVKPEYEDVKKISTKLKKPYREVYEKILKQTENL
ncbi:MAG: nickel insertion protein [Candidatus Micrarchaeia archaeon]